MIKLFKENSPSSGYTIVDTSFKFYLPPTTDNNPLDSSSRPCAGGYFYPAVALYGWGPQNYMFLLGSEAEDTLEDHREPVSWLEILINIGATRGEIERCVQSHTESLKSRKGELPNDNQDVEIFFTWGAAPIDSSDRTWQVIWDASNDEKNS